MRLLLFGQLKILTGQSEVTLSLASGDAAAIWQELVAQHPLPASLRAQIRFARNGEFASASTVFTSADEIALIPPVSGG